MALANKIKDKTKNKTLSEDSIPSFIRKTYEILEKKQYWNCIRWSDDGANIIIVNPTEFAQNVLPIYFKHNNLTSFIRQLNMYDFHKKRGLNTDHVYYHDLFQRGKEHLLKDIRRKSSENMTPNTDKSLPSLESTQTRQDLVVVVHENVLLKQINQETLSRVNSLEAHVKELELKNQNLWNQTCQLKEKENLLKNVIINFMKQNGLSINTLPPFLQSEFEFLLMNPKMDAKENSPAFIPQTTTKPFPSGNLAFPQNYQVPPDMRLNQYQPPQSDKDLSFGNGGQPIYLDNFNKIKPNEQMPLGEAKFSPYNFDNPMATQNTYNMNYGNPQKGFGTDENIVSPFTNTGKRKYVGQGDKDEGDVSSKKIKLASGSLDAPKQQPGDMEDRPQAPLNYGMIGEHLPMNVNVKEEDIRRYALN